MPACGLLAVQGLKAVKSSVLLDVCALLLGRFF